MLVFKRLSCMPLDPSYSEHAWAIGRPMHACKWILDEMHYILNASTHAGVHKANLGTRLIGHQSGPQATQSSIFELDFSSPLSLHCRLFTIFGCIICCVINSTYLSTIQQTYQQPKPLVNTESEMQTVFIRYISPQEKLQWKTLYQGKSMFFGENRQIAVLSAKHIIILNE